MANIIKTLELDDKKIEFLAGELKNGKIFILPTSTIYGICCNALDEKAVKKVYDIKRREYNKPLIVLVYNLEMLNSITYGLNDLENKLIDKFWPGPLSIVLKKNEKLPNIVTANKDTVGVRIDSNDIINKIIKKSGVPIVAPSANISGNININSIEDLENEIIEKVDYIIDTGKIDNIAESTLIRIEEDKINILREGKIKKEEFKF